MSRLSIPKFCFLLKLKSLTLAREKCAFFLSLFLDFYRKFLSPKKQLSSINKLRTSDELCIVASVQFTIYLGKPVGERFA